MAEQISECTSSPIVEADVADEVVSTEFDKKLKAALDKAHSQNRAFYDKISDVGMQNSFVRAVSGA